MGLSGIFYPLRQTLSLMTLFSDPRSTRVLLFRWLMLRVRHLRTQYGRALSVLSGQLSVRKGPAGSPAPLNSVASGLDCQA
jgi:hypothetical protein